MSAPHADRDHSEQPSRYAQGGMIEGHAFHVSVGCAWHTGPCPTFTPSMAMAGSDPTQGTSRAEAARESDEEVVDRIVDGARQLALVSGVSMREALDTIRVTADLADAARERERAESAEAERDEIARRLSALLCELTGGRLSKTTYDVPTMVAEIDSAYDDAQREERAEMDRLAKVVARVEALADELASVVGSPEPSAWAHWCADRIREALSGPSPAQTPATATEPAPNIGEAADGQSRTGQELGGAEKGAPSIGDTCCGKCPGGTCYVDGVTGA